MKSLGLAGGFAGAAGSALSADAPVTRVIFSRSWAAFACLAALSLGVVMPVYTASVHAGWSFGPFTIFAIWARQALAFE
ncbi:MAG: hypothetical protein JWQ33_3020, partial [Ramlibacter sp.]|nr:hypothetical protein [Ramlibacter sp.]